ncbi:hypothetical protein [Nitrosococcus wardiae]|uniref:Uncharacterized protein n=1 Tax=Nitrosococcus wardiae TaxID=1814290 RepID=A0A4P7BWP7_9GAMM|nr:hypothetical protein [Nitrosococcus wardiae]QBQ54513.1 hypothetical protein E3U44_08335 [Nitrosococcus wardiae]
MITSQDNSKKDVKALKTESLQGQDERSSSVSKPRRTLLKGAAAVPVIMTLPSGAAVAMSSYNSEACIAKDQQLAWNEQPNWLVESTDTWVRKEVKARQLQSNSYSDPFWVYQPHEDVDRWLDEYGRYYYTQSGDPVEEAGMSDPVEEAGMSDPVEEAGMSDPVEEAGMGSREDARIAWARRAREEAGIYVEGAGNSNPVRRARNDNPVRRARNDNPMEGAGNGNCTEEAGMGSREDARIAWARRAREEAGIFVEGAGNSNPVKGAGNGNCTEEAGNGNPKEETGMGAPMEETENGNYMIGPGNSNFLIVTEDTPRYVIAQVDESGAIIGFGPSDQFNHITGSCWYSVNPTTI